MLRAAGGAGGGVVVCCGVVCVKCQVSTADGRKCQPSGGATESERMPLGALRLSPISLQKIRHYILK